MAVYSLVGKMDSAIADEIYEIDGKLLEIFTNYFENPSTESRCDKFIDMIKLIKKVIKYGDYNYLTKWFINFTMFAIGSKQSAGGIVSERILFYISHVLLTKMTVNAITHFELYYYNATMTYAYNTSILSVMLVYMNEYKLNDHQKFNGFAALTELSTSGIDKLCTTVSTSNGEQYSPMMLILIMDPTSVFKNLIYKVKSIELDLFKTRYCDYAHFEIAYHVLLIDIKRLRLLHEQTYPKCCNSCSASELKLLVCKRCKSVYYCSKQCQQSDWNKHREICVSKKELYDNVVEFVQSLVPE